MSVREREREREKSRKRESEKEREREREREKEREKQREGEKVDLLKSQINKLAPVSVVPCWSTCSRVSLTH